MHQKNICSAGIENLVFSVEETRLLHPESKKAVPMLQMIGEKGIYLLRISAYIASVLARYIRGVANTKRDRASVQA